MRPAPAEDQRTNEKGEPPRKPGRPRGSKNRVTNRVIAPSPPPLPPEPPKEKKLLTLAEAAVHLGHVHRTTIMRWVKEGRLRCVKLTRKSILFELVEIERFVREHRHSGF